MTLGELIEHAKSVGYEFYLTCGNVCISSPLLGSDHELTRRACAANKEMKRRFRQVVGYLELKLMAIS